MTSANDAPRQPRTAIRGRLSAPGVGNTIGYAGYVFNAEVPSIEGAGGLYTVRFRNYDPSLARWLERDPLGYVDGMSLYGYGYGSPMLGADTYGLDWRDNPGWRKGRRVIYHHRYETTWNWLAWAYIDEHVETRWTYVGNFVDNRGQSAYQRRVLGSLNDAARNDRETTEGAIQIVGVIVIVALPGADDVLLIVANGTRFLRIAGKWYEEAKDGSRKTVSASRVHDELADALGYTRVNSYPFNSHGQPVYKRKGKYITPDKGRHRGGAWEMFDRRGNRLGTYNENLEECLGP